MLQLVGDVDAFLCGDDEITKSVIDRLFPNLKLFQNMVLALIKSMLIMFLKMGFR